MRQRAAVSLARSASLVAVAAVCAVVTSAGLLGSTQQAGAVTPPVVPGAPTGVSALSEPGGADIDWIPPASDGGARITKYKIFATDVTDPSNGGQTALTKGFVGQIIHGLTAGDSYTFTVTATNSAGTGPASDPSDPVVPTSPPPPGGIRCAHVIGTTGGAVTLSSCRSNGKAAGTGSVPGNVFIGTATGTFTWTSRKSSYSTTVSTTTSPDPSASTFCARQGFGTQYIVNGTVTANTDPDIAVGQSVDGLLCISPAGAVRQTHYGSLSL
jgi:hypothetical protein